MRVQNTIANTLHFSGIGLHSGQPVSLALHPAPADTGVVFMEQGGEQVQSCPATIPFLRQTDHCTTLESNGFQIQTVEHILSALAGLEVDNVYVELQGMEVPSADGSAAPFVESILQAGIIPQEEPRTYLKIVKPIQLETEERSIAIVPSSLPHISYSINFPHPLIQEQEYHYACSPRDFQKHIAPARTFSFRKEVEYLWSRGLGLGGSLHNTIVFSDTGLLNEEPLRFPDECVRHKILDLVGDLALLGIPVIGHIIAKCAGHTLHTQLVQAILQNPEHWIVLNGGEYSKEHILQHTNSSALPAELQPALNAV